MKPSVILRASITILLIGRTFFNLLKIDFTFRYFKNTSNYAKDFISRLFVRDATQRATVEDCLHHPWIKGPEGNGIDIRKASSITIAQIQAFKTRQKWRVLILKLIKKVLRHKH